VKAETQTLKLAQREREKLKQLGMAVVKTEAAAAAAIVNRIDDDFVRACELMLACQGRIVVIGIDGAERRNPGARRDDVRFDATIFAGAPTGKIRHRFRATGVNRELRQLKLVYYRIFLCRKLRRLQVR